ncbi:MAG TPA: hypothetical protein VHW66_02835 [Stellaceae bacterium]|jgi:hypothetical protein|nr:hypothetical protein [Stellaceae bacterium]
MKYRIISYDCATDLMSETVSIPAKHLRRVLAIARIVNPEELGEFPLEEDQARDIAALIGFDADVARFHYHLEQVTPAHVGLPV